jgi:eukaryotic-like serine/threonine-protein kinase
MDVAAGAGRVVGRYVLYDEIASGGMATVHLGRMLGQVGFARVVAVKRLHSHLARDPEFVAMFLDEARLAAGVRHPNVVATLDVVAITGELFLVMEYVEGDSLSHLIRATRKAGELVPLPIVTNVICGMLYGLHAAHIATDDRGLPLGIVHRDVSPQNILIGIDGVTRVADFGVAKAERRLMETEAGRTKGKFSYMAPEQVRRDTVDCRADVFCAGICAWEALTGHFLFRAEDPGRMIVKLLEMPIDAPSKLAPGVPAVVDEIVLRALERDRDKRFQSAREMAIALEDALPPAISRKVGEWVSAHVGAVLEQRHRRLAEMQDDDRPEVMLSEIAREVSSPSLPPAPIELAAPEVTEKIGEIREDPEPEPPQSSELAPIPALDGAPPLFAPPPDHTPISQLSGMLSASYTDPPRLPLRRLPLVITAAAIAGAALVGLFVFARGSGEPAAPGAAAPPPSAVAPRASLNEPPRPLVEPAPPPEVAATPAPSAAAEPQPDKPRPVRKPAVAVAPIPASKPAPTAGCNPPYTIVNGIKKFKRHCL